MKTTMFGIDFQSPFLALSDWKKRARRHEEDPSKGSCRYPPDPPVPGDLSDQRGENGRVLSGVEVGLGGQRPTAWRMHHKLMQAMAERETLSTLKGQGKGDHAPDTMHNFEFDREIALDRLQLALDIRRKR